MKKYIMLKAVLICFLMGSFVSGCAVVTGREQAAEYTEDMRITTDVKTAILADPHLKMFQIHVETFKSTVQLSGFVESVEHRQRAEQLTHKVSGVKGVTNNIIVR